MEPLRQIQLKKKAEKEKLVSINLAQRKKEKVERKKEAEQRKETEKEQNKIKKAVEREKKRVQEKARLNKLDKERKSMLISLDKDENGYINFKAGDYIDLYCRLNYLQWHIFGCKKDLIHSCGFLIPLVLFYQYKGSRIVWFTNFSNVVNNYHYGQIWKEEISFDEEYITRTYLGNKESLTEKDIHNTDCLFVVIGVENGFYKFYGLYEKLNYLDGIEMDYGDHIMKKYRKVSNNFTYKIYNFKLIDRY